MEFPAHLIDETAGRLIMNGIFRSLADGFFQDKLLPFLYQRCSAGSPLAGHCIVSRKRALRGAGVGNSGTGLDRPSQHKYDQ